MRAVSCCALPRSRAVYARVCCEKRALARVVAFTRSAVPHCSRLVALPFCATIFWRAAMPAQSYQTLPSAFWPCSRWARKLAHIIDTSNAHHNSTTSPNHVQPNRKRSMPGLIPQEPTKPARVVAKLAALVVLASPPPVRAARHEAARRTPPARRTRCLLRAPPLESRRIKRPKAKGCPNAVAAPRKDEAVHGHAPRHAHQ